jgi:hypothetical protein
MRFDLCGAINGFILLYCDYIGAINAGSNFFAEITKLNLKWIQRNLAWGQQRGL